MLRATVQKLRSSPEAVLGWKSYLHDMNELSDEENRAKKVVRGQEYTYKAVLGSLRRVSAGRANPRRPAQTLGARSMHRRSPSADMKFI